MMNRNKLICGAAALLCCLSLTNCQKDAPVQNNVVVQHDGSAKRAVHGENSASTDSTGSTDSAKPAHHAHSKHADNLNSATVNGYQ